MCENNIYQKESEANLAVISREMEFIEKRQRELDDKIRMIFLKIRESRDYHRGVRNE